LIAASWRSVSMPSWLVEASLQVLSGTLSVEIPQLRALMVCYEKKEILLAEGDL